MVMYSHSKLSTFEQCKFKYKLRYIDKIKPDVEKSIEAHLGTAVHDTLEWIYVEVSKGNLPSIDDAIKYYSDSWERSYVEDIVIVKKEFTARDYFNKGVNFILNYYTKNCPFQDGTLELEKKIILDLDGSGKYKIQGFIDRLVFNKRTGEYEVHDYKTANSMPSKEKVESDRQLALYSIAIKEIYGQHHNVLLTWHYLAHGVKICSRRTQEQLEQLKNDIMRLIDEIEATNHFPTNKSILCDWCEFKSMCPHFGGGEISESIEVKNSFDIAQKSLDDFPTIKKYIRD